MYGDNHATGITATISQEMSMTRRRHYLLAALSTLAGVLALPQAAEAQPAWPAAPVKIVVPIRLAAVPM